MRASELRERQLWLLTVALLVLLGAGCIVAGLVLVELAPGDDSVGSVAYRLLAGLAVLIGLFCLHVLQARTSVSRVKLFLNAMGGMVTGSLKVEDCLAALVKGFAATYRAPFARFLYLRDGDDSLELAYSHVSVNAQTGPASGYVHAVDRLSVFSEAVTTGRPQLVRQRRLRSIPDDDPEKLLLTGGLARIGCVLLLPVVVQDRTLGFLVLGKRTAWWRRRYDNRDLALATLLVGHAGSVIEDVIRRRNAVRDPLTDLYNRRHLDTCMQEAIGRASRGNHRLAVLLCDLDRFKQVNDSRGHQAGDEVLKLAANAVRSATRGNDLHFRWGGDELIVVLCDTSLEGAITAAGRIRQEFLRSVAPLGVEVDMSIGAALYPEHAQRTDELIRIADLAMYIAKRSGKHIHVGLETYRLDEGAVRFVFQPIHDARSGALFGHEVFVRDPAGRLAPRELFRRYSAAGQLDRLKHFILEQQLARAAEAGLGRLFVNADTRFLKAVPPIDKPPTLEVVIEIPDHELRDQSLDGLQAISGWRQAGYGLALSGVGDGLASMAVLAKVRPDYVKLEPSSLGSAKRSRRYSVFLQSVLEALRAMTPAKIIAEHIEDEADLETARVIGADFAQGFFLGRPAELGEAGESPKEAWQDAS